MTTKTKSDDTVAELATLDAEITTLEERSRELHAEWSEKRQVLNGPDFDANAPGLLDQLRSLRFHDPAEFTASGEPTGPDAKKLQAEIDEIGDLEPLAQEAAHADALLAKRQRDRDGFIRDHADELLATRIAAAENLPEQVAVAVEHLRSALTDYLAGCGPIAEALSGAGRDSRIVGEEQASNWRRSLEELTLPAPRPMYEPEAAAPLGTFENPSPLQTESTMEME